MKDLESEKDKASQRLFRNNTLRFMKRSITCESLVSDRSRGEPPVFSYSPPEKEVLKRSSSRVTSISCVSLSCDESTCPPQFSPAAFKPVHTDTVSSGTNGASLKNVLETRLFSDKHSSVWDKVFDQTDLYGLGSYQRRLKSILKQKNECLIEELMPQETPVLLTKIYTDVNLTEVNNEHEVRQIELAFNKRKTPETPSINSRDIFKAFPNRATRIRTVLTTGIAGIGKTVLVQKFILDWAEGKANQDFHLLFPLSFRELNLLKNRTQTLMELLYDFFPGLRASGLTDLTQYKVLFILDGLDESRLQLDFSRNYRCFNVTTSMSTESLLTNLIMGTLLPDASLWITARPAAAGCISPKFIDRVTEIRGFNNLQKEAYFLKKIVDENLARRVLANIRSARSLYIMCHLPVFCWISSIVLGECTSPGSAKMPKTLTQMYIHFLTHQMRQMQRKYRKEPELDSKGNNKVIMSLGKLAFEQLEKGNLIFYKEDLNECGIDVREATVYSGLCTQVFREETWRGHRVFSFVHLSVQEFLAALYVQVLYNVDSVNLMVQKQTQRSSNLQLSNLHKAAVDRALRNQDGHFDLFLRFVLGLSLESSQTLLKGLNIQVKGCDAENHKETVDYVTEKISQTPAPQRKIKLLLCLNELNDCSLFEEIQVD